MLVQTHGFIEFKIDQHKDLSDGTVIENQVAIFFDFNKPIITNQVFNTIGFPFTRILANSSSPEFPNYEVVVMPIWKF